jgi:hypothetical protein
MTDLRYPIGKFEPVADVTQTLRNKWIDDIAKAPGLVKAAVAGLTEQQLDTPYRPEGWTVRQVVHHLPDSHLNAYGRFKLALTENEPTVKPYAEDRWANLEDGRTAPVEISLALLDSLHRRWVLMLRSMSPDDFKRTFHHPDHGVLTLNVNLGMYAWHGRHHAAHITSLRDRKGWR